MSPLKQSFLTLPHRRAWHLAWPMIISNVSLPLMGLADTAMLGHLDNSVYLGAVAVGSNIIILLYWMFSFIRMGTTSVTAQAVGADKPKLTVLHLTQSTALGGAIGVILIAVQAVSISTVVRLIAPDPALLSLALEYCHIRIYSAPAVLMTYAVMGWLIGLGNTKIPLVIAVGSNLLNIGLDYLFIVELQQGAAGAATATLIAEYFALAGALGFAARVIRRQQWPFSFSIDTQQFKQYLRLSSDIFIRTCTLLLVINFFNAQSAQFGHATLAANAVLFQCILFVSFFLDGYALAAETMTAQAIGAGNTRAFHQVSAVTSVSAFFIAILLSLLFWLFGQSIISLLTDLSSVREIAHEHLNWLIAMPIAAVGAYALDGVFIGSGQTRYMRNTMLLSALCIFFPVWWMSQNAQNHGLWLAFFLFNLARGLSLGYAYFRISKRQLW